MQPDALASVPRVCDVTILRGPDAAAGATPDLLIEIPHGATRAAHYDALRAELRGAFPDDLRDFFFVNTDVGAPETAAVISARAVTADPRVTVSIVRCLVPRTFIDCNRVIAPDARPVASAAGAVTPGLAPWVTHEDDVRLLLARYAAYRDVVTNLVERTCESGGSVLMLHTYAPRSIDVPVDDRIVERLRDEYAPDRIGAWPLRAEVDLISRDPDGRRLASGVLVANVATALDRAGIRHAEAEAYALHPVTLAWTFASRFPGRTLCVEIRRDLLAREFTPFAEMEICPDKAARLAAPLADAWAAWRDAGSPA